MASNLPNCKAPCKNCPFKKDTQKGWLGEKRMQEILSDNSFVCHKTTQGKKANRLQCAGFMLIKKNESSFYSLATKLNIDLGLKGHDQVFETKEDCIEHHKH